MIVLSILAPPGTGAWAAELGLLSGADPGVGAGRTLSHFAAAEEERISLGRGRRLGSRLSRLWQNPMSSLLYLPEAIGVYLPLLTLTLSSCIVRPSMGTLNVIIS